MSNMLLVAPKPPKEFGKEIADAVKPNASISVHPVDLPHLTDQLLYAYQQGHALEQHANGALREISSLIGQRGGRDIYTDLVADVNSKIGHTEQRICDLMEELAHAKKQASGAMEEKEKLKKEAEDLRKDNARFKEALFRQLGV